MHFIVCSNCVTQDGPWTLSNSGIDKEIIFFCNLSVHHIVHKTSPLGPMGKLGRVKILYDEVSPTVVPQCKGGNNNNSAAIVLVN